MPEHKLSEQEIKPFPFYGYAPGNYMNTCACCKKEMYRVDKLCFVCLECAIKASYATITRERKRAKGLVEKGELLAEGAQHLFDMKKQKGSTSVMKNAWNILAIRLYDLKEALNNYKNNK